MENIGIRRLKNETSAIIRAVREQHEQYIVTYHGKAVAIITPIDDMAKEEVGGIMSRLEWEKRLNDLADEIDAAWQNEKSAVELVSEQRR